MRSENRLSETAFLLPTAQGRYNIRWFTPRVEILLCGPVAGVPEDPVTGSAHTRLVPYWAERLGRGVLFARQISARGGELWCELHGERVHMAGEARLYLEGKVWV